MSFPENDLAGEAGILHWRKQNAAIDLIGLHRYLDVERQKRKLSWAQLAVASIITWRYVSELFGATVVDVLRDQTHANIVRKLQVA